MYMSTGPVIRGWKGDLLALLAGGLIPLAFAPFYYYPIALLSLFLLLACWDGVSIKQAAWRGWLFGLGMFGVGVSWVFVAIHVFGHSSIFLAGLLTFAFVAILSSYLALLGALLKKITIGRFQPHDSLLLFPVGWLGFELFKAWFLSGFPWLEIGVSQIDGPLAGWVPVVGVNTVSLLVAFSSACLYVCLKHRQWFYLLPLALIWISGPVLQQQEWTSPSGTPIKTSIIQGNVPQDIKWNSEQLMNTLTLYENLTELHWDSDLVVWPENALPAFYHQLNDFYLTPLQAKAREHHTDILLGLPVLGKNGEDYYNSMMVLGAEKGFYHKQHLVPFGDYVPFAWLRGLIAFFNLPMSGFVPGNAGQELLKAAGQSVGVSICYEDVFSMEVLQALPEANILVNATNNAWYGDSFAPHQHFQISRSRALETGRPLVRATTNGISALVDSKGRVEQQTSQFEQATLTGEVQPREGETPYVAVKRWPLYILVLVMLLLFAVRRRQ